MALGLAAAPWLSLSPSKCWMAQVHPPPVPSPGGSQRPPSLSQHRSAELMVAFTFVLLLAWPSLRPAPICPQEGMEQHPRGEMLLSPRGPKGVTASTSPVLVGTGLAIWLATICGDHLHPLTTSPAASSFSTSTKCPSLALGAMLGTRMSVPHGWSPPQGNGTVSCCFC